MYTISAGVTDQVNGIAAGLFLEQFLEICRKHREDRRALVFAFLLDDFGNTELIKVLQDPEYWTSLNKLSGSTVTVFSFHSVASRRKRISRQLPNFTDTGKDVLRRYFKIDGKIKMPSILFFQVEGERVIGELLVQIRATTVGRTYRDVKDIINTAVEAVKNVTPENYKNSQEIFDLAHDRLSQRKTVGMISRGVQRVLTVNKLFGALAKLWQ